MARNDLNRPSAGKIIGDGIGAGILGGVAMAAFMMMYAGMTMGSMLVPLRMLGATFYGPQALVGGTGVLMWGMVVHLMTSAILGVVFTWIVGTRMSAGASLGLGAVYGLIVLVVLTYLVVPWANPTMSHRIPMITGAWVVGHLIYGAVMGVLSSAFVRRPERAVAA